MRKKGKRKEGKRKTTKLDFFGEETCVSYFKVSEGLSYWIDNVHHSRTYVYVTLYFSPRNITTAYTATTKTFAAAQ